MSQRAIGLGNGAARHEIGNRESAAELAVAPEPAQLGSVDSSQYDRAGPVNLVFGGFLAAECTDEFE